LKITLQEQSQTVTVKLEGRLAGPWVSELKHTWQKLAPSLHAKELVLDLTGVTYVDFNGKQILAEIYEESGNRFVAVTPMTRYFAEEIMQGTATRRVDTKKEKATCEDRTVSK
jgi:anti-anti-sigma regulatory factor